MDRIGGEILAASDGMVEQSMGGASPRARVEVLNMDYDASTPPSLSLWIESASQLTMSAGRKLCRR